MNIRNLSLAGGSAATVAVARGRRPRRRCAKGTISTPRLSGRCGRGVLRHHRSGPVVHTRSRQGRTERSDRQGRQGRKSGADRLQRRPRRPEDGLDRRKRRRSSPAHRDERLRRPILYWNDDKRPGDRHSPRAELPRGGAGGRRDFPRPPRHRRPDDPAPPRPTPARSSPQRAPAAPRAHRVTLATCCSRSPSWARADCC